MSIQTRALFRTMVMMAITALGPIAIVALFQLDAEILFNLFILTIITWMIWVMYSINLAQLETEQQVKEIQDRTEKTFSGSVKNSD